MRSGDILLVRDGTYLIGTNCFVGALDTRIVYQSHILKIRVNKPSGLSPHLLFIAINSPIVQSQIRSVQFTADTIDTIGNRYLEIRIPIPRDSRRRAAVARKVRRWLAERERGKAFIRQAPVLLETVLRRNSLEPIREFVHAPWSDVIANLHQDTTTSEFGNFSAFWKNSKEIRNMILLPKYYSPEIDTELSALAKTCDCVSISKLLEDGILACQTGDEIGKMAYGTGSRPFLRTSDLANWEIKHDPKQGVSEESFHRWAAVQDVRAGDVFLVRDGTYLVGTSSIATKYDPESIYCGGLYKLRVRDRSTIDGWLLLALLNSYVVKRQLRSKQFTRDVIDTLGKRLEEVVLPIPKARSVREGIADQVREVVLKRTKARQQISRLAETIYARGDAAS